MRCVRESDPEEESEEGGSSLMNRFINKVFTGDSLDLLRVMPTASVDAVITDAMFGTAKNCVYEWGPDPAQGNPALHWLYHRPIYDECRRVLRPGGS